MITTYVIIAMVVLVGLFITFLLLSRIKEIGLDRSCLVGLIATITLTIATCSGLIFWLYGTESGKRAIKDTKSNLSGGIERIVTVYDIYGEPIKEYSGKFDIEYDSDRIKFDDENGKRHIIYYTTGTVIIDEK